MKAVVFSRPNCGYCVRAKAVLKNKGVEVEEQLITKENQPEIMETLKLANNGEEIVARSVPQVILEGKYIGGYDQVCEHYGISTPGNNVVSK